MNPVQMNDELSNKNLLLTKAKPNIVIPTSANGRNLYECIDCGDQFILESSYNDHIDRKSTKITYSCRVCKLDTVFYNRCNFLFHVRSHSLKTAIINVSDLKVEPLRANFFKANVSSSQQAIVKTKSGATICIECKTDITLTGDAYKDQITHLMQHSEVYTCPVCLLILHNICTFKLHLRLHLKCPPYYCPECCIHLANKNVQYPYYHDCKGFKMMRVTARVNCSAPDCLDNFHPNNYKEHMAKYHFRKVYKCPFCVTACLDAVTMEKHLITHETKVNALVFYKCDACPPREYVLRNPILNNHHLKHFNTTIFPCWTCRSTFKEISGLLTHFIKIHNENEIVGTAINAILKDSTMHTYKPKRIYRVIKSCKQCKRSFTYECKYDEISVLSNECPFNCEDIPYTEANIKVKNMLNNEENHIICPLCKNKVSQHWSKIKKHYAKLHKTHKCLDVELPRLDIDIRNYYLKKILKEVLK